VGAKGDDLVDDFAHSRAVKPHMHYTILAYDHIRAVRIRDLRIIRCMMLGIHLKK
jgi:hypothetical protein